MQTFKLLSNDSVLLSQPVLIKQFGRAGAHFLSQLHYWLNKNDFSACQHQGTKWIYNTAEDWAEQLQLSSRHVRRLIAEFVHLGIVRIEKLHKIKSVRTNYYSIDYDRLNSSIDMDLCKNDMDKMSAPLGQKVPMYIQKLPNKDFNKSEQEQTYDGVGEESASSTYAKASSDKQVQQVNDLNLENKKKVPTGSLPTSQRSEPVNVLEGATSSAKKTTTAQDMLKIWNKHFPEKAKTKLTKDIAPLLVAAFKQKFVNDLKSWEGYCQQIKSSSYLMGDPFKLKITWALKFTTIERIRAGELGASRIEQGDIEEQPYCEQQIKQMVEALDESFSAKSLRYKIIQAIGHNAYYSWFHQADFCEEGGGIRMVAPNAFVGQYWETHFAWVNKN